MKKIKKIAKYVVNILCIISALIAGINAIEGITIPYATQIIQVIAVINGVIGTYLLGNKAISNNKINNVIGDTEEVFEELEGGVE